MISGRPSVRYDDSERIIALFDTVVTERNINIGANANGRLTVRGRPFWVWQVQLGLQGLLMHRGDSRRAVKLAAWRRKSLVGQISRNLSQ